MPASLDLSQASAQETADLARELNEQFAALDTDMRLQKAFELFGEGLIATSSFGRDAALLLHHLHRLHLPVRVFFIDTGFHFPETLAYRDTLADLWNLRIETLASQDPGRRQYAETTADAEGKSALRIRDTDACCGINKVTVQRAFLARTDVSAFLSALRRDQSDTRKNTPFALVQRGRIKLCPFADWPQDQVELYLRLWETPEHPLAAQGYTSIGCSPLTCTQRPLLGEGGRSGRWSGEAKTECGLHLDLDGLPEGTAA
jgi:phosphoadenosine phosphosulfate reductase